MSGRDWRAFDAELRARVPELVVELLGKPTFRAGQESQVRRNRLGSGQFLGVEPSPINGLGWLSPGIRVVTLMLA
jgi:hypothetical protein